MIGILPDKFKLAGDHCLLNIALDENLPKTDLILLSRDPRKLRLKPDAYVAVVEAVGPRCEQIKPGDKIVVERWEWLQLNVDDERIVAREKDVLILASNRAAKDIVVMKLIKAKPTQSAVIVLDDTVKETERLVKCYFGKIISSGCEEAEEGDLIWVQKYDRDQWKLGSDKIVFKWDDPNKNKYSCIKMMAKPNGKS